ncbi:hypothetical protein [Lutibacter sp.]|uniref:hypothetical protein n=1 Tax=Lutibacter sp. TaxID=1925666 RepID=UPI0025B9160A|nr:hypothetical protein [Lutibacter sp.]MCF6168212.1 hypothetical protein [Lutibacter sp.]
MKLNKFFTFGLFALLISVMLVSCRKKEDTVAVIRVLDASSQAVVGATVIVYGQSTTNQPASVVLYDTTITNSAGEAIFNFDEVYQLGQAGVAVLNIDVTNGSLTGEGIIKVEQETTTTETVFVQ